MDELTQDPLRDDAVQVILRALVGNEVAKDAFTEGLGKHLHFLSVDPGPHTQAQLLRFMHEWVLDVALINGTAWSAAVAASEAELERGEVGEPSTQDELRALLDL